VQLHYWDLHGGGEGRLDYTDDMVAPKLKDPWYQFSLRSLMLLVLVVALLCSLGKCTHWLLPVVLAATVLVGGTAGRIVSGIKAGFVQGALYGIPFFLLAFIGCAAFMGAFPRLWDLVWWLFSMICGIAVLLGGVLGGYSAKCHSDG